MFSKEWRRELEDSESHPWGLRQVRVPRSDLMELPGVDEQGDHLTQSHSTADEGVLCDLGPISVPLWVSASPSLHSVACAESVVSKMNCELKSHGELLKTQTLRVHLCLPPGELQTCLAGIRDASGNCAWGI